MNIKLLSDLERRRHVHIVAILNKAARQDLATRKAYFERVDERLLTRSEVDLRRREVMKTEARVEVEGGLWEKEDALTMEEWDEDRRVKRKEALAQVETSYRFFKAESFDRICKEAREMTVLRREVRREMQEEEEKKKKGNTQGKGENPIP